MKNKKSEDEILGEFLETFELHHSLKVIKAKNYSKRNSHAWTDYFMWTKFERKIQIQ